MPETSVHARLWSPEKYDRLVTGGMFPPEERLELIAGEILQKSPQGSLHAVTVTLVEDTLRKIVGETYVIRVQMPLAVSPDSEPELDLVVVPGTPRDYRNEHPQTAELVVEVADTTLTYDRTRKSPLYARARIQAYWILNLIDQQLEVYRHPNAQIPASVSYRTHMVLSDSESFSPIYFPQNT